MNAAQVPDAYLEMTANAVRICRRADDATTATDVLRQLMALHPGCGHHDAVRAAGYAARLLETTR